MTGNIILESKGITLSKHFIPPFKLREGELLVIRIFNEVETFSVQPQLADIFTGKTGHENITRMQPLFFVPRIRIPGRIKQWFAPFTVERYLARNANGKSKYYNRIYADPYIKPGTRIETLNAGLRKLLSVYTTLSKADFIIFDLGGLDPMGADNAFQVVNEHVAGGGAAILIDQYSDMKDRCTTYIEAIIKQ